MRSDTNQAVQPQKMARGWKFRIKIEEGLYYPYSENEGADQLCMQKSGFLIMRLKLCLPNFNQSQLKLNNVESTKIYEPSHLDLQCLQDQILLCLTL